MSTTAASASARRKQAIRKSGAPPSIATILDDGLLKDNRRKDTASIFIRQIGCTRRVFLLKPFMSPAEIEGMAYRMRTLTKNDSINSVLIATDDTDDVENGAIPSLVVDRDYPYMRDESVDPGFPPKPGQTWHVAGGYDPLALYRTGLYRDTKSVEALLSSVANLALAMRGDARKTKIPTISLPHGFLNDGGFALCGMSTYVLATRETSFAIRHPSKGLGLDPVGFSYILPRLGQEFQQPSAQYPGCGMILGLTGYTADAEDMMETGLATNYIETPNALGLLEHTLSEIRPWNQQGLLKNPIRFHGDPPPMHDHNAQFRNVAVADAIHCFSSYRADGAEMWVNDEEEAHIGEDPSFELEKSPWHEDRVSDLVNYAATFADIFSSETTLVGILERFREVASKQTSDPEEQEGIAVARDFIRRMEQQSPLALNAVFRLLKEGSKGTETLQTCMAREKVVQSKLIRMSDFENWAQFATKNRGKGDGFTGWKHKKIADVTDDEVAELLTERESRSSA